MLQSRHLAETVDCLERIGAESWVAAWDDQSEAYSSLDVEFYDSGDDLVGLTADTFLKL